MLPVMLIKKRRSNFYVNFVEKVLSINRLAIPPLSNLSPAEENEYFVDGITADLITKISKIQGIRVIARSSIMLQPRRLTGTVVAQAPSRRGRALRALAQNQGRRAV